MDCVGHGNAASTHIYGTGVCWTPEKLNTEVEKWLDRSIISRISLHMCFGGGNPNGLENVMPVDPKKSFAMEFAKICRVAKSVTARTDDVNIQVGTKGGTHFKSEADKGNISSVKRIVGEEGRYKGNLDKYIFSKKDDGTVDCKPCRA